jgi:NIPSNAP protein
MTRHGMRTAMAAGLMALALGGEAAAQTAVVELRQYKIVPGRRDAFIALFDREFVETQEAVGMRLVGQFRDLDDPDRFVWIRAFDGMPERERALTAFYGGPIWQAHRGEANPMLFDNDNVLLLRPAAPDLGFGPGAPRDDRPRSLVVATIYYLWKDPAEGFADFFDVEVRPQLEAAGLPVLAELTPEPSPNTFPRLPVRQGEKVFVWFTRVVDPAAYAAALKRLEARPGFGALRARLEDAQERRSQVLRLAPTSRSALR